MIKRITIGDIRITFTIVRIVRVGGFNSLLTDGNHILMWDFDDTNLDAVSRALRRVQVKYKLPRITILETKFDTNYIAYCFKRMSFREVVTIVSDTKGVDFNFFKFGVYREKFTLRVTDKGHGLPHHVMKLPSKVPEDVAVEDLATWVNYETLKRK